MMASIDHEELDFALAYLAGALPCRTQWVGLADSNGELLSECISKQDQAQVVALLHSSQVLEAQTRPDDVHGLRFTLNYCAKGAFLVMPLSNGYHVLMTLSNIKSMDAILNGIHEGVMPLRDLLGINA